MGIEAELEQPIPDGQTVPHQPEVAEAAVVWDSGTRRARLRLRLWQGAFWLCCILAALIVATGR